MGTHLSCDGCVFSCPKSANFVFGRLRMGESGENGESFSIFFDFYKVKFANLSKVIAKIGKKRYNKKSGLSEE